MKKLIALVVLALLGFYVAWPAWSGYRIASALASKDTALLESKIDFPSVRESLRPVVTGEVEKEISKQAGGGLGGLLSGDFKKQIVPQLVDTILAKVVTGENVIRIVGEGGDVAGSVQKILMEQMSKMGGIPGLPGFGGGAGGGGLSIPGGSGGLGALGGILAGKGLPGGLPSFGGGQAQAPAASAPPVVTTTPSGAPAAKAAFGLANIKRFALTGPAGYAVSVAKDANSSKADATASMAFTGFDWKITSVVPHL
jgi:Protein of unknown function (DUF2939)